jgi:hypothetical protein
MAEDKKKHLVVGLMIAAAVFVACLFLGIPAPGELAFAAAALAGIAKEAYDATGRGKVEVMDALATAAGGVPFLIWGFYG